MAHPDIYAEIREHNERWHGRGRHRTARRLGRDLYAGRVHLLAELVQNAEDAGAETLVLWVLDDGLLVWNDGRPFEEADVWAIAGLFETSKTPDAIGYFGIGFKAVLKVTDEPRVLSGPYRFRLEAGLDPYPLGPGDDLPREAWEWYRRLGGRGAVFWFPWRQGVDAASVRGDLQTKEAEVLLFLDNLRRIEIGPDGAIWAERFPRGDRVQRVVLRPGEVSYWRRVWEETLPEEVVQAIIAATDEEETRQRWRQGPHRAKFGIAVRIDETGKAKPVEGRLFVYLPTLQRTGLAFHLQARMALSLDRTRVEPEAPLSRWALEVLTRNARSLPAWLEAAGLFPSAWHVFPTEEVEPPWDGIARALRESLRAGRFFYGDDGRAYPVWQVLLAHRDELYGVLGPEDLAEVSGVLGVRWVHPELRRGRAVEVLRSLGVSVIGWSDVFTWLETKKAPGWWASRDKTWLDALYEYLGVELSVQKADRRKGYLKALGELPLVRLRDGRHVRPGEAVLPPEDPTEIPEVLREELDRLPVVAEAPAQKHRSLLRDLGVGDFDVELLLNRLLWRFYGKDARPDASANLSHVRLLFRLRERIAPETLRQWGREIPFLRDREGRYVKPCEAYLPAELGGVPE